MVKIAIAGGTGSTPRLHATLKQVAKSITDVAQEIIDVLVATKKHDIIILTRRSIPTNEPMSGIQFVKTEYGSIKDLARNLHGVHTVLSFIAPHRDQEEAFNVQKNLIDASIEAGVKRFAPSEWGVKQFAPRRRNSTEHLDPYFYKAATRAYLEELNKDGKVLEYCLFQPGLFTNYLTAPYKSARYLTVFETPFDFGNRRLLVVEGGDDNLITFTTVQDLSFVVAKAVDFEGEWPAVGGIVGTNMTIGELIALGTRIRGGNFDVTRLKTEDLKNGTWKSSWLPLAAHPSIPPEQVEAASKAMVPNILLAINDGAFVTSDEWNKLLPDYEFTNAETFVKQQWRDKE